MVHCEPLLSKLAETPPAAPEKQEEYWPEEMERVRKHATCFKVAMDVSFHALDRLGSRTTRLLAGQSRHDIQQLFRCV